MATPREPLDERAEARIRRQPLDIVVFGPGRTHTAGWGLREAVRAHIAEANPGDTVAFPEEIISRNSSLRQLAHGELFLAELAIVRECDLVIALIIDDPLASGVLVELGQFLAIEELRGRFTALVPDALYQLSTSDRAPYAFHILRTLRDEGVITYAPEEIQHPEKLLERMSERILAVRAHLALR